MRILKLVILLAVAVALASYASWAKAPKSAIINSPHDLRATYKSASFTACSFCHVAHKTGSAPVGPGPLLWNHKLSSVANYGVYQSDSFNGLATDISDVGGATVSQYVVSNLCLSCHDGTVAVNSFYTPILDNTGKGTTIPEGTTFMPNDHIISGLSKTHPVHFTYNAALATKAGMLSPAGTTSVDGAGEVPLYTGKMECGTCHDPHNGKGDDFFRAFPAQASGTFCTYCHL